MKKSLSIIIALLLIITTTRTSFAEERQIITEEGFYNYILIDKGKAEISKFEGDAVTITIPAEIKGNAVISIGDYAFFGCKELESITIPDSVTSIGNNPFIDCTKLSNIYVSPDHPTLATIDGVLFSKADKRLICYPVAQKNTEYSIPQGIQIIGDLAFYLCNKLTDITIPNSVFSIEDNSLLQCYNLSNIHVLPDHPTFETIDGVLFSKADKRLIYYPIAQKNTEYSIPQSIQIIGGYAFCCCENLWSITIPDSVKAIGPYAFSYCKLLKNIILPNSITSIGNNAFANCYTLRNIAISDNVTSIEDSVFSECWILDNITVPSSVTSIGNHAFFNCWSLKQITVPDSVATIGDNAFEKCTNLTTVIVDRDSYAKQYCIEHNINYTYPDANNWLIN